MKRPPPHKPAKKKPPRPLAEQKPLMPYAERKKSAWHKESVVTMAKRIAAMGGGK